MQVPQLSLPPNGTPLDGAGAFSPAIIARRVASLTTGTLRASLGSEAERIGDADAFARLIATMLAAGADVRLTAKAGRPVEVRGPAADIAADVALMGGWTEVDGPVIRAILPLPESVLADAAADTSFDLRLEGCHLLVADDSATNRFVLSEMLRSGGAQVSLAESGPQAVTLTREAGFDLLLLDIAMPGMDGTEALAAIRAGGCATPAVAVTANAMAHQVEEYLACGFASHLAKPLRREDLIRKVAGLIG